MASKRRASSGVGASRQPATPRSAASSSLRCSTCGRRFLLDETDSPPFCSERCKLIDLGRWLDEEVGLPHEGGPVNGEVMDLEDDGSES